MKVLCDRVKENETQIDNLHERLRVIEKEVFGDAEVYEEAHRIHEESKIPVKGKPVEVERDPYSYEPRKDGDREYPQYDCDGLEINCIQIALDHLKDHLEECKTLEDSQDDFPPDEIEIRLEATTRLINALKGLEDLSLFID